MTAKCAAVLGCEIVRVVEEGTGTVNYLLDAQAELTKKTQRKTNKHPNK